VELHILDHAHGHQERLSGVKLDARHSLLVTVVALGEGSGRHLDCVDFPLLGLFVSCKHLEVVLKDVDDFVGLKRLLHDKSHFVDELVEFFLHLGIVTEIAHLLDEVFGVVLAGFVYTPAKVGLSLYLLNLVRRLETALKNSLSVAGWLNLFDHTLAVSREFGGIFGILVS